MTYIPLHHKYRPQTFTQLVGQDAIATTLSNALQQNRIAPAYLFTGARGTGKTSSARIFAKSLNCIANNVPTPDPCGVCETCRAITNGSALDVIEIDAASNTGVDNIRELIERAQFAPVQCRYKVYVIDECLTGDSLVQTSEGLCRIDNARLEGKKVLSYNEKNNSWEYKKVIRWLDQGERQVYIIRTGRNTIRCTGNHLIRTEQGWIPARDVKERMRILSPVPVAAGSLSTNMEPMGVSDASSEDTNFSEINLVENRTILTPFLQKRNPSVLSALVDAAKNWLFPTFLNRRAKAWALSSPIGNVILTLKGMEFGTSELKTFWEPPKVFCLRNWDWFMEPSWGMALSTTPINSVDSHGWCGLMELRNELGYLTNPSNFRNLDHSLLFWTTQATGKLLSDVQRAVTLLFKKWLTWFVLTEGRKPSPQSGWSKLRSQDEPGGIWTMDRSASHLKEARKFNFTQKDFLKQKISYWLNGWGDAAILPKCVPMFVPETTNVTITSQWERNQPENGLQITNVLPFPKWHTSSEVVESVSPAGVEKVYDIEVEDNHNFVANGLLVHNCHMLSAAAFNALLKTLEEPPERVVFVLATTDPQRVLPTIISRCQRFDFRRIPLDAMVQHLGEIAQKEAIPIAADALQLVAQISQGGLRDAESLLDQLSLLTGEITVDRVWDLVGAVPERDLMSLLEAIASDDPETVLDTTRRLMDRGREPLIVLQNLASFYRDLLIAKTSPNRGDLVALTAPAWEKLCEFAKAIDLRTILAGQQHLKDSEVQLKHSTQPRLWLEVTLMGLLPSAVPVALEENRVPRSVTQAVAQPKMQPKAAIKPPEPVASAPQPSEVSAPAIKAAPVQPIAQESPPQETAESSTGQSELAELWQTILNHIDLDSTRGIVSANCDLLQKNEHEIIVGVRGEHMLKMIQRMLPQIKRAATTTFKEKVEVSLQVVTATPVESSESTVDQSAEKEPKRSDSSDNQTLANPPSSNREMPTMQVEPVVEVNVSEAYREIEEPPVYRRLDWDDDEVTRAAMSLAEAFNGTIVDSEGETLEPSSVFVSDSISTLESSVPEEPDDEDDDDEDVDF